MLEKNGMKMKRSSRIFLNVGMIILAVAASQALVRAQAPIRTSYDEGIDRFTDTGKGDSPWKWNGGDERTIYNPLDGGVLLKYKGMMTQGNSDGCSAGAPREKQLFQKACFAHDTDYDAPFPQAGFPGYPDGGSTGQDISDFLVYKDIQYINNAARAKTNGFTNSIDDTAADLFYTGVVLGGHFRGTNQSMKTLAKGGVIAVNNNGAYVMTMRVKWTGPDGTARTIDVTKPSGWTAVVPLSIGATNISVECWAVGGTSIFTKTYSGPGMYAFTVNGTTLVHSMNVGLTNTLQTHTNSSASYKFQIHTADVSGAGTDSNIFIKICGDNGCTSEQVVNPLISGNAFERNQTDTFTVNDPVNVGNISSIQLRSDTKYAGSDWALGWIIITKDSKDWVFQTQNVWIQDTSTHTFNLSSVR
jgi:hypothetical protein